MCVGLVQGFCEPLSARGDAGHRLIMLNRPWGVWNGKVGSNCGTWVIEKP